MAELNPIIAAYLAGLEAKRQREEFELNKALRQKALELQERQQALAEKSQLFKLEQALRDMFLSGAIQPETVEGLPVSVPFQGPAFEGVTQNIPRARVPIRAQVVETPFGPIGLTGLSFPQDIVSQEVEKQRAQIPVEVEKARSLIPVAVESAKALAPFEEQKEIRKTYFDLLREEARNAAALERAKLSAEARTKAAEIGAAARIKAAEISASSREQVTDVTDEELADTAIEAALGRTEISGVSKNAVRTRSILRTMGFVPVPPKQVEQLAKVMTDQQQFEFAIKRLIPHLGDNTAGILAAKAAAMVPGTPTREAIKYMEAHATPVVRALGDVGAISEADKRFAMGIIADINLTKQQAIERLQRLNNNVTKEIHNKFLKGVPPRQKLLLMLQYNIDPIKYNITTLGEPIYNVNPSKYKDLISRGAIKGVPLFIPSPSGKGYLYWNEKTQKYESPD